MKILYTKNGKPLQLVGDSLYSKSGAYLGRVQGGKTYHPTGRYAGTIINDRVIHHVEHSAALIGPSMSGPRMPILKLNSVPAAAIGDEPTFQD